MSYSAWLLGLFEFSTVINTSEILGMREKIINGNQNPGS